MAAKGQFAHMLCAQPFRAIIVFLQVGGAVPYSERADVLFMFLILGASCAWPSSPPAGYI